MRLLTQDPTGLSASGDDAFRQICARGLAEPQRIWDLLEAEGISATPGAIYLAFGDLTRIQHEPTGEDRGEKTPADDLPGLTAEDVEAVISLAEKAGGVEQLVRFLGVMRGAGGKSGYTPIAYPSVSGEPSGS